MYLALRTIVVWHIFPLVKRPNGVRLPDGWPRVDPRTSDTDPLSSITNILACLAVARITPYYLMRKQQRIPTRTPTWKLLFNAAHCLWTCCNRPSCKRSLVCRDFEHNYAISNCDAFFDTWTRAPNTWARLRMDGSGCSRSSSRFTQLSRQALMLSRLFFYDPN